MSTVRGTTLNDFSSRTTITSVENPDFEIWLELNSPYEFSTAYSANNRTDSLHHKLLSYRQNRNDAKIYSGVQVAILTLVQKFKRGKHPCTYYSNWILGLQIMTTSQLSQLIVLVGAVLRCLPGQQSYHLRQMSIDCLFTTLHTGYLSTQQACVGVIIIVPIRLPI